MNLKFEKTISELKEQYDAILRSARKADYEKEKFIKFQYELRGFIEGELKRNVAPADILTAVLTKLKVVTPHGAEMRCDQ
jgi:hypothetical protein